MLHENRVKKTPEEIKKARAMRIKETAKEVLPNLLAAGYHNVSSIIKASSLEDQIIIKRGLCMAASELAIMAGAAFEDQWKKKKGEFMAD